MPGLGKRIALDIARGLHFLHTHRIVSLAGLHPLHDRSLRHLLQTHCIVSWRVFTACTTTSFGLEQRHDAWGKGRGSAAAAVQSAYQSASALRKAYQQVELAVERLPNQQLTAQVHMDVKTPNVLLGRNNVAKLADVGLAKFLHKDYLSAAKSVVRAAHPLLLVWR